MVNGYNLQVYKPEPYIYQEAQYEFEIDDNGTSDNLADDFFTGNQELVTINYTRNDVYVSRACGYKTIFENVATTLDEGADGPWIFQTIPQNDNLIIEDETTTHYTFSH